MSGPTQVTGRAYLEQLAYVFNQDTLPCCGCTVHSGPETSDCDCRCHWAARLVARKHFVDVKR